MYGGSCRELARRPFIGPLGQSTWAAIERAHRVALREAQRLCRERRDYDPTGVQALLALAGPTATTEYGQDPRISRVNLRSEAVDEPVSSRKVLMLEALETEEAAFYAEERSVMADPSHRSQVIFKELEQHYGFLGGEYSEYVKYLNRLDLVRGM